MMQNTERPVTAGTDPSPLRMIKDSVFRDLFQQPQYLLQLYQVLHPEDETATETDLGNVTIQNILMGHLYNDLGFTVRGRLLVMVEAQSTWSVNIVIRLLMYLAETWNAYIQKTGQNPYHTAKISLPMPEFYVICTGSGKQRPEWISLSQEFLCGDCSYLELRAKVLYGSHRGDILDQYVEFTKVYDTNIREYGRTEEAILETIRICKSRNILKSYLESRETEVKRIMLTLFNQEYLTKLYGEEKLQEGALEKARTSTLRMHAGGMDTATIAAMLDVAETQVEEWIRQDSIPA